MGVHAGNKKLGEGGRRRGIKEVKGVGGEEGRELGDVRAETRAGKEVPMAILEGGFVREIMVDAVARAVAVLASHVEEAAGLLERPELLELRSAALPEKAVIEVVEEGAEGTRGIPVAAGDRRDVAVYGDELQGKIVGGGLDGGAQTLRGEERNGCGSGGASFPFPAKTELFRRDGNRRIFPRLRRKKVGLEVLVVLGRELERFLGAGDGWASYKNSRPKGDC